VLRYYISSVGIKIYIRINKTFLALRLLGTEIIKNTLKGVKIRKSANLVNQPSGEKLNLGKIK
jgi:hypothetical protein